jgi:ABC-type Zn uptake system ZnuABC Zn-binding protein ZnuA
MKYRLYGVLLILVFTLASCQKQEASSSSGAPKVLASVTFLADLAQNVAGDRLTVEALVPGGADPHSYDPTPADAARLEDSQLLILNGQGFEDFIKPLLDGASGQRIVMDASSGLPGRTLTPVEPADSDHPVDPHFWLDPTLTIRYVENIRDGLSQVDPQYADLYQANASAYIEKLKALDAWIQEQVNGIPSENRVLVTNHESLGYFADRYGFTIAGAIIPSVSSEASPSAQEITRLLDQIKSSGAKAVFLETGANPKLAEQIARETGIKVAPALYTHSLTDPSGEAPTYIDMLKADTNIIVSALK